MNKRILFFLTLMVPALFNFGQNPGYQGRRVSLNYSFYTFNALNNPNEFGHSGILSFNTSHYANIDIALRRKITLGLSFEYIHTGFKFSDMYSVPTLGSDIYARVYSSSVGKMEAYSIGFYPRFFFKGNIAPLGTYIKPEIDLIFYKVYPGNPVPTDPPPDCGDPVFSNQSPYMAYAISLELGQNRILFNRLFIDYGLRLKVLPGMWGLMQGGSVSNKSYLKEVPYSRLGALELFNIKVGLGVLLF
jgi:hypothetical protein